MKSVLGVGMGVRHAMAAGLVLVVAGCNGCPNPNPAGDGGLVRGKIIFFSPVNNATITSADDADPNQAGIQVEVEVRGDERVNDGTHVRLTIDSVPNQTFEANLSGRTARFTPTIPGGAFPDGRSANLTIAADGVDGESIAIKVIENAAASCSFTAPVQGDVLRSDSDTSTDGFQSDVTVRCSGSSVNASGPVRLQVFRGNSATGTPVSTTSVSLSNGQAVFQDVTLLEGAVTLQASVASSSPGGGQVGLAAITVTVDTNRCDAFISAPSPQSVLTTLNTTDLDTQTTPLDLNFTVQSALCANGTVVVTIENGSSFMGSLTGGSATVRVALPQGTSRITARVSPQGGARQPGDSPPASYTVDTLSPCPTVSRPIDGATLTAADDEEMPQNAANGVTYTLQGAVDNPEGTSSVHVSVVSGAMSIVDDDFPLTAGAFTVPLSNLGAAPYTITVSAQDDNGNRCPAQGQPPRSTSFGVSLDAAAVTMSVVNDTQPQNGTLILAEDANTSDAGMQARVRVVLANQDPANASARIRFQPVDDMGNPAGTPIDREVALASDGSVEVEITLADGRYRLSVVVAFADGRPSVSPAMSATVVVDGTPPDLGIRAPVDGAQLGSATVDVEAVSMAADLDPSSLTLSVNGVASMAMPVAGGAGVYAFAAVALTGAMDGHYQLTVSARDVAGNAVTASIQVTVDDSAPVGVVMGLDKAGATRALGTAAGMRAVLDISTAQGLAELDYDGNAGNGLQYGFVVEVPLADCMSLGANPNAVLDVSGIADQQIVTLTTQGGVCRGTANGGGAGLTLRDGDGQVTVTLMDAAGNAGSYPFFFTVRRQANLLRIDTPEEGTRIGAGALTVVASSDLPGGTCELLVDTVPSGMQAAGATITFTGVMLTGGDGTSFSLVVSCTGAAGTSTSLPVTVTRDLSAPTGGVLTLADGTALPGAFNTTMPSDGPASSMRYLRDLAVEVDAEGGNCARFTAATLTVTPMGGTAATVMGGSFQFIPGTGAGQCRSVFPLVDLGAKNDPGLTSSLSVGVTDTAGNAATVGPVSVLNDQVAPVIMRVRPTRTFLLASDDTQPMTPGLQTVIEYSVTQDGRPGTAGIACTGTGSACPAGTRVVAGGNVIFGEAQGDVVTLTGTMDGATNVVVTVADAAGNAAVDTVNYTFDVNVPVLEVLAPADNARFNAAADANGSIPGVQVSATVRVRDMDANQTVLVSVDGGAPQALCALSSVTQSCTAQVTVPQGAVALVFSVADASGNTARVTRNILVDSAPPVVNSIQVLGDVNQNLVGNIAEDGAPAAGFQTSVRVTISGAEDGQMVTLLSNNPAAGTQLGTEAVTGGVVTFTGVTLAQGTHLLTARVADLAGNTNDPNANMQGFTVDVAAPTVTISQPSAAKLLVATDADNNGTMAGYLTSVTVVSDVEPGQQCSLADGAGGSMFPGAQVSNGSTASFSSVRLAEGTRALTATCTDAAGNSATSAVYAPLVDTLAPRILSITPSSGVFGPLTDADATTPGLQLRFTITHANADTGLPFTLSSSLEPMLAAAPHGASATGSTDVVVTFTQEGMHTITVSALDGNGNSGFSAPFTIDVQTGQWNVAITQPATSPFLAGVAQDLNSGAAGLQTTVTFTTNAPAGSTAHLTVNGMVDAVPAVTTSGSASSSTGTFNVTFPAGDSTFSVRVDSGTKDGTSSAYQIYADLTPPAVTITQPSTVLRYNRLGDATHLPDAQPADAPLQAAVGVTVTGCGTAARPGQLDIRANGVSLLMAPVDVTADGPITPTPTVVLPEGAGQTLQVRCLDQGGNLATDSKTITVDSVLPGTAVTLTATIPETANGRHRRKGDVTVTFTAPGDDGQVGQLPSGAYELRWMVSTQVTDTGLSLANFNVATPLTGVVPSTPGTPGTTETLNITGMKLEQFVFFGVRITDDEGNQRVVSTDRVDLNLKRTPDVTGTAGSNFASQISHLAGSVAMVTPQVGSQYPAPTIVVGAPGTAATDPGEVRVYTSTDGATLSQFATLVSTNPAATRCGFAAWLVPDLDGDNRDEVATACTGTHPFLYLWYGRDTAWAANTPPDLVLTATLTGTPNFGRALTVLDFDGDGNRDLAVSAGYAGTATAAPHVYILYGTGTRRTSTVAAPLNLTSSMSATDITATVTGTDNPTLGTALGTVRLADGDSRDELLIGSPNLDAGGLVDSGAFYVVSGRLNGLTRGAPVDITAIATGVRRYDGSATNQLVGAQFVTGDFDGDGDADVAVAGNAGTMAGVRIYPQKADGTLDTAFARVLLNATQDRAQLAAIEDFNGDGKDDLLVSTADTANVILGMAPLADRSTADYTFTLNNAGNPERVGAVDINGDGYGDVVIASQVSPGTMRVMY